MGGVYLIFFSSYSFCSFPEKKNYLSQEFFRIRERSQKQKTQPRLDHACRFSLDRPSWRLDNRRCQRRLCRMIRMLGTRHPWGIFGTLSCLRIFASLLKSYPTLTYPSQPAPCITPSIILALSFIYFIPDKYFLLPSTCFCMKKVQVPEFHCQR